MNKIIFLMSMSLYMAIVVSCENQNQAKPDEVATKISEDSLRRMGEYLVNTIGCDDCHSPKIMGPQGPQVDMSRRFSGHPSGMPLAAIDTTTAKSWLLFNPILTAFAGPWGVSYSANISSDATGIGNWSEQQFFKAIREGKAKGIDNGRMLLPPMPWQNFAKLNDRDLKAIYTYLKSTKPVENRVPAPLPPNQLASK